MKNGMNLQILAVYNLIWIKYKRALNFQGSSISKNIFIELF